MKTKQNKKKSSPYEVLHYTYVTHLFDVFIGWLHMHDK